MAEPLIIQQPAHPAQQLVLLFHGVGGTPEDMAFVGRHIAQHFAHACVVSIGAPLASDTGTGYQWFPVRGITEENRAGRIAAALPAFLAAIRHWQDASGVDAAGTALVGFSQGAIMALAASQTEDLVAGRVAAFAGRFADLPRSATRRTTLHLFHGKADPVIAYSHTVAAAECLVRLGGDVTADVVPFVGHEITGEMLDLLLERLTGYIPRRCWDEALRDAAAMPLPGSSRADH